jgi:hypothetical protein
VPKTEVVQIRHTDLLGMFNDAGSEGLTISEIQTIMNMNYYTVLKDLRFLESRGQIGKNGRVRDKSEVWAAAGKFNVPTILVDKVRVPFTAVVDAAIANAPTLAVDPQIVIRATMTGIAARAKLGVDGDLNYYPTELKRLLVNSINTLEKFTKTMYSILEDTRYWNEAQLVDVLDVDEYDRDVLLLLARTLLGEVNVHTDA